MDAVNSAWSPISDLFATVPAHGSLAQQRAKPHRQERQAIRGNRPIWNEAGLFYALRITDSQWRALGRQDSPQQLRHAIILNLLVRLTLAQPLLAQPDLHRNAAARCGLELRLPQPHQCGH